MFLQTPREIEWRRLWPTRLITLLATLQLFLTLVIIGLEATSVAFDINHSMSFAGFYCSAFFTVTWISMYSVCEYHAV